jgi:GT2 family glycosyltransferase
MTAPSPRFSVVTATRDAMAGLTLTWQSLAAQIGPAFEWIVADGDSHDDTVAWLSQLADDRVRWTSQPDRGVYDAMNRGLSEARGELVLFLNAGDHLYDADVLASVHDDQQRRQWRWGYGATQVVGLDGAEVGVHRHHPFRRRWLEWGYRSVPHPSTYFTRGLLTELGGYDLDYPVAADQELMLRAARLAEPGVMEPVLATFALGGASSRQSPDAFVRQARQMRQAHHRMLAGSAGLDAAATTALAVEERLRAKASRAPWRQGAHS